MSRGTPSAARRAEVRHGQNRDAAAYAPAPPYSALLNRRVSIRYPVGAATRTTMARQQVGPQLRRVRVQDLSQGGIALLLRRPLEAGVQVYLQIANRILGFSFDLAAEVRHATPHTRGRWLVGLAFARELSLAELATLL